MLNSRSHKIWQNMLLNLQRIHIQNQRHLIGIQYPCKHCTRHLFLQQTGGIRLSVKHPLSNGANFITMHPASLLILQVVDARHWHKCSNRGFGASLAHSVTSFVIIIIIPFHKCVYHRITLFGSKILVSKSRVGSTKHPHNISI